MIAAVTGIAAIALFPLTTALALAIIIPGVARAIVVIRDGGVR